MKSNKYHCYYKYHFYVFIYIPIPVVKMFSITLSCIIFELIMKMSIKDK